MLFPDRGALLSPDSPQVLQLITNHRRVEYGASSMDCVCLCVCMFCVFVCVHQSVWGVKCVVLCGNTFSMVGESHSCFHSPMSHSLPTSHSHACVKMCMHACTLTHYRPTMPPLISPLQRCITESVWSGYLIALMPPHSLARVCE